MSPAESARTLLTRLHLIEPARAVKHRATAAQQRAARAIEASREEPGEQPAPIDPHRWLVDFWQQSSSNWYYDILTVAVIERVLGPQDLAIDIGAHSGDVLQHMVGAAPGVTHIAIEPLPHLASDLRINFPSVDVHEVALVAEPSGPLQFHHVTSNPGYSGILQRSFDRPTEDVELIEVETARLDDLVDASQSPKVIKLDVEGAELGVLKGASRILSTDRPVVIFEHGLGAANHYDTTPRAMFDLLDGHGYEVFLLGTWLEAGPPLSRDQFVTQFEEQRNYYFLAAHP